MARAFHLAASAAALLALSACASADIDSQPTASAGAGLSVSAPEDTSVYGLYLAGQAALDSGDTRAATELFGKAQSKEPNAVFLKDRVFTAALMAGDVAKAAALAPTGPDARPGDKPLSTLTRAVEALAEGHGEAAYQEIVRSGEAGHGGAALALLKPWTAAAAGHTEASLAMPELEDRLTRIVASIDQGLLMERAHKYGEAETTFRAMLGDRAGLPLLAAAYGPFLERRGRRKDAVELYDQVLATAPDDADMLADRARAASNGPAPPAPTIRQGAAQALLVPAAVVLADKEQEAGLVYLRLALRLDPTNSEALLLVGDALGGLGDTAGARSAFAQVGPKSSHYVEARTRLTWSWQSDDKDLALKLARETVQQRPDSTDAKMTLADILRADDQYDESAKVLDPIIAAEGEHAGWRLYYMRGVALERAGHWPEAERDLEKALQIHPDQPEVLNYLGYSWINRGLKIKQGLAMIEKALDAQPDEGAYVDSMGWAYYRLGDYTKAVQYLERAATLDAGDAEINDHLGDAYWRVGRKDEARFQWRAVLTMKPPAEIKTRVETKLASPEGVDAVTTKASAPAAASAGPPAAKPETVAAK